MPLDRNQFERAIERGNYIDAVEQTLKADDPDDPREELRDRLFRQQRLFENALRQAVSEVDHYDWLVDKQRSDLPPWWTKHDTVGVRTPEYYTDYRSRFIKAQLFCAVLLAQQQVPSIENFKEDLMRFKAQQFGFSVGFLYDCAQVFCTNALTSVDFIQSVKVPVLLVAGENGGAAYLHLEQVTLGIDSEPYPHPINMSMIPIDKRFNDSVINAFRYFKTRSKPKTFRWWLQPIEPPNLNGVQHGSLYGAFLAGMHSSVYHHINWPANTVVTCGGDEQGQLYGIDGLAKKCEAAIQQGWNTVIVSRRNYQEGNALSQELRQQLNIVEVDDAY